MGTQNLTHNPIFINLSSTNPIKMDLNNVKNLASQSEDQNPQAIVPSSSPFATASLSLSLATILPTHFFAHTKISSLFSPQPSKVKVPTQASALSHLSLSATSPSPSKISFKSSISANPLHNPLSLGPRRPSEPSNAAGMRRASIVLFRNDLRTHDNECLNSANNESMSVLPLYCFDPQEYRKSSSERASFLIEAVSDLRKNLQAKGSELVVRIGKPEQVLVELVKAVGADAVYAHREISRDDVKAEASIEGAMKEEGVEVKYFWGSTLHHLDDMPFKVEDMPTNYGAFSEKVKGLEVRKTIASLDQLKGKPARGDVEAGDIPSLKDFGLSPTASLTQVGLPTVNASQMGGETEGLQKLNKLAAECQAQPNRGSPNDTIYGANFSSKIAPWLSAGCISPRSIFDELKKTASSTISAINGNDGSDGGSSWLMNEMLWRDFFRCVTMKYSSASKQVDVAPAMA